MSDYARQLALAALEIGAIQLNPVEPFTWASGFRMPVYNDNRLLLSRASVRKLVAQAFAAMLIERGIQPAVIAGTATAGIPHATSLADLLGLPLVYVREKAKDHGMQNQIEGMAKGAGLAGRVTVLVEDLVSTGGSSLKALQALRVAGGTCPVCLAIFSYGFPEGVRAFQELDPPCTLLPLLTYSQLIAAAASSGALNKDQESLLREWGRDPFGWGAKHGFPKVERA